MPFITLNGREIGDSQLCIEYLSDAFNIDLNKNSKSSEKAAARAFLKLAEESLFMYMF